MADKLILREVSDTQGMEPLSVAALIRDDAVHSSVYSDRRIFDLEMDRLFGAAWLLVGHRSQLPRPGCYITASLGSIPVMLVRTDADELKIHVNRCAHRGARLVPDGRGEVRSFVCPYHGWTYSLGGALRSVPLPDEYKPCFLAENGLVSVPRVASYRGFVFASAAAEGVDLLEYLGPMKDVLDDLVDRAPQDDLEISPVLLRHRYRGNWKLTFENLNDTLHAGFAHAAAVVAARRVVQHGGSTDAMLGLMLANGKPPAFFRELRMTVGLWGHSYFSAHMPGTYDPGTLAPYKAALSEKRGEAEAERILAQDRHLGLLYPGSLWHARYQTVRIVQPLAPDLTEVITMLFRLKGAPEATFDSALAYCNGSSSPLSSVITDDLELYEGIQARATAAPAWLPLARLAGEPPGDGEHPATSEVFIRNQYRAWLRAMNRK